MDSFYITAETAHELIGNYGFQFSVSERRVPTFIDRKYLAPVFKVMLNRKRITSYLNSDVPFIELNTNQVLELIILPTEESRHILIDSSWKQFSDAMESATLFKQFVCFAH